MTDIIDKNEQSSLDKQELAKRKKALRNSGKIFKFAASITVGIIVTAVVGICLTYSHYFPGSITTDHERWGTLGDFFGGVLNPFLAFISFIALLWTIKQQNDALLISAEELEFTRKELEGSKEALTRSAEAQESSEKLQEQQSEMLQLQQFENSFYSLLEQHNQLIQSNNIRFDDSQLGGGLEVVKGRILDHSKLSMYMRLLYQLLKFITVNHPHNKESKFDIEYLLGDATDEERRYTSIVRSCIDNDLIKLIAINAFCCDRELDEFYEYFLMLERYRFLEHIEISSLSLKDGLDCICNGKRWQPYTDLELTMTYNKAFGKHGKKRLHNNLVDAMGAIRNESDVKHAVIKEVLNRRDNEGFAGKTFRDSYFFEWYRQNSPFN